MLYCLPLLFPMYVQSRVNVVQCAPRRQGRQATPAEYVFPAMPFITEEPGPYQAVSDEPTPHTMLTEEPAPQNQAVSDEPMPQNAPTEEPAPYQAQAVSDELIPQNAPTEE